MSTPASQRDVVQGLMVFLSSAANGLEEILGRGAGSITYRSGRQTGLATPVAATATGNLERSFELVWEEMCRIGMRWAFEAYHREGQPMVLEEGDRKKVQLVFRNCQVRCALFRYGHPQRLSLCLMNHGLFCGLFEQIYGERANLDIVHAGENACLKVLTIGREGGAA